MNYFHQLRRLQSLMKQQARKYVSIYTDLDDIFRKKLQNKAQQQKRQQKALHDQQLRQKQIDKEWQRAIKSRDQMMKRMGRTLQQHIKIGDRIQKRTQNLKDGIDNKEMEIQQFVEYQQKQYYSEMMSNTSVGSMRM